MDRLHVVANARSLGDDSTRRGIGTYVRHVLGGLAVRTDLRLTALATRGTPLPPGVGAVWIARRAPARLSLVEEDVRVAVGLRRARSDVLWSPGRPPCRSPVPFVQTLHDTTPLLFPSDSRFAWARRQWRSLAPRFRRAAAVIAVTRAAADQGVRHLGIDPARVHVIHHGVACEFRPPAERVRGDPPYLLLVSAWGPHKGFEEALGVLDLVVDAGLPHRLKVAGHNDRFAADQVGRLVSVAEHPERIEVLGFVDDLADLYQRADALLSTSRAEGFGLPVLEAMACGTPVVAFSNTSLPEVIGDGGVLVPDGDVRSFADAVLRLLGDPDLWGELSQRGLARSRAFDWATAIAAHAAVLQGVAAG